jgi:hypothetical protein
MSEPPFPFDPLPRKERIALIQANLQKPQVNHHPTCICCKPRPEKIVAAIRKGRSCPRCAGTDSDCLTCRGTGEVD